MARSIGTLPFEAAAARRSPRPGRRVAALAPEYEWKSSRSVPIAMIMFGLLAVFMGLLNPGGAAQPRPGGLTTDQLEQVRADANAGFPRPPLPDNPPRGPGQ